MIDAEGRVRVLDFGIARTRLPEPGMPPIRSAPPAATPAYASCERLVQERPDARDDVFSFSCIAYELLAGKHPFDRSSALQARKDGRKAQRVRDLSRRQWATLESGLAWAREDRPANMRALLLGLGLQSSASAGTSTGRVTWHRAAAGALIALGTAALLSWAPMRDRIQNGGERRMVAAGESAAVEVSPRRVDMPAVQPATAASAPSRNEESETPVAAKRVFEEPPRDTPRSTPEFFAATPVSAQVVAEPSRGSLAPPAVTAAGEVPAAAAKPVSEPMDVLGFSRHSFSVSEADSVVHVSVRRLGGATGEVKFQWYTVDDSARAGQDYVYGFGEVQMPPGQTTATFEVPIVTDTIREDPELLQVIIGSSSGAQVGAAGRVPVIIVDDD